MALILALACLFCSCSQVEDARTIVAEADSLRNAGQSLSPSTFHLSPSQSDSCAMADAAATLEPLRLIYPTASAHANYYYGRLLREAGNHPEAMLAFLRVIHSRTKDHIIKGRSYCNIGIMCGLATEHELAYDMYERSAEEFLKAQDSIAYFYALNDMALELASCNKTEEALSILNDVYQRAISLDLLSYTALYKAIAYKIAQQYDSALLYADIELNHFRKEPAGSLVKAQSYSALGINDSALYYANQVVYSNLSSNYEKYNMLFILSHSDSAATKEEILTLTSDRADLQMEYTEGFAKYSQATQLLEQDLNRKPNLGWLLGMVGTLVSLGVVIIIYVKRKGRKHQLVSQQVNDLLQKHDELSEQYYLLEQKLSQRQKKMLFEIESFCKTIQSDSDLEKKLSWNDFDKMCAAVDEKMYGLATKLKERYNMDLNNLRLCILITIGNFANKKMAKILNYNGHTFRTIKNRVAHKLNISGENMRDFFIYLMIEV